MLLVIRTQTAIVRAPPLDRSVVLVRHLRRFDEHFAGTAVVINIVGDEHAFGAVRGAAFEQEDVAALEDDLALDLAEAGRANGDRNIVVEIWTHTVSHSSEPLRHE